MFYKQQNRTLEVTTPLGPDKLIVSGVRGTEAISEPFSFQVQLASDDGSIDLQSLVRKPFVIQVKRQNGSARVIHGLVASIRQLGMDGGDEPVYYYEAEIAPWLWFLKLNSDVRIFQNKTVPQI